MFPFSRTISEEDLVDLQDKVVIVTGSNTGLGFSTVQFLVRKGAKVYIAARSESKALAAIQQLKAEDIGTGSLEWLYLDLSDPRLAKKAAEDFMSKEQRLDILVNNAAIGKGPFSLDKDGLSDVMVTNYLSHYVFTRTLIPVLKKTAARPDADVRIINVTSAAHTMVHPTTFKGKDSINTTYGDGFYLNIKTYGLTKLANILHTVELQRSVDTLSPESKIICLSVHPGTVKTTGAYSNFRHTGLLTPFILFMYWLFFVPGRSGAMNVAWAAAGKEVAESRDKYAGKYIVPVAKVTAPSAEAQDERLAKELLETTEEILKELEI